MGVYLLALAIIFAFASGHATRAWWTAPEHDWLLGPFAILFGVASLIMVAMIYFGGVLCAS